MDRSTFWYLIGALSVSIFSLACLMGASYYVFLADEVLGHGPLPSSSSEVGAYVITLLTGVFSIVAAGVTYLGLYRTKTITGRFFWMPYVIVIGVLLAILLLPLQRFGEQPQFGLPNFLVSVHVQITAAMVIGGVFFAAIVPVFLPVRSRRQDSDPQAVASTPPVRGLPGKFTPSAWRTLSHMQEEARRFQHGFMGTEHLLLGMLRERDALAARTLTNLAIDVESARVQLEGIIGRRGSLYTGTGGLTQRCRRVIESGARIARESGRRTVGTGHILRSLMVDPEDAAGQLLESLGVTEERIAQELEHLGYETEEA